MTVTATVGNPATNPQRDQPHPDHPQRDHPQSGGALDAGRRLAGADEAALFEAVRRGDPAAWGELVGRYSRLLWSIANSCRLSQHDAEDVIQTTWIRLLENLDRIREPENVHKWLAVTARRECWRTAARAVNGPIPMDDMTSWSLPAPDEPVEARVLREEDARCLWQAVGQLPRTQRRVVRALLAAQEPTYDEIARHLGIPRGSLGPTRSRALQRLRMLLERPAGYDGPDDDMPGAA